MRDDNGVAGEERTGGVPKFHSWGKCTLPLTNINSDWMSNTFSSMCIILPYFTIEVPTCFDSYNQPRLGGGRLFEHAAIEPWKRPPKSISTLLPCSCINN